MILTADYHTHTKYSHGKGSVLDNALAAKKAGLKELAITDHGFNHPAFGLKKHKLPHLAADVAEARAQTGVNVLAGIEANIISESGKTDLKEKYFDCFDVFLAGFHKFVLCGAGAAAKLYLPNYGRNFLKLKPTNALVKRTTKTYIEVIKNNPVDAITHLNFCVFADAVEVAKAAADYGTYIEINAKKTHLSDEELCEICAKTSARFIVGSDAHAPERVGEISLAESALSRVNFDLSRIDNIDGRLPKFRFKAYKEKRG
ncbi:MAG: hypothetical protein DBX59_11230 [Bacillota bacterium]|nr:MAG: hypothetical protein DBX59_11230 [Bacillota bacterium]